MLLFFRSAFILSAVAFSSVSGKGMGMMGKNPTGAANPEPASEPSSEPFGTDDFTIPPILEGQVPRDGTFNYRETVPSKLDFGPPDWGKVRCNDINTCPGWPTNWENYHPFSPYDETQNRCVDCSQSNEGPLCEKHRMSPIALFRNVTATKECVDRHRMKHIIGDCKFRTMDFQILPHVLRMYVPKRCPSQHPQIDFSKGFPVPWNLRFTDISVPSQHTQDGKRYHAEVVLSHTYSINNGFKLLGNVAIFLEKGSKSDHYDFLELYLREWMREARKVKQRCARQGLGIFANSTYADGILNRDLEEHGEADRSADRDLEVITKRYFSREYDPYDWVKKAGTEYYFRYVGSTPEPPCFGPVHWRVLKDPVKVSPKQIVQLERLTAKRIDPDTCEPYTAGKPRPNRTWKVSVNRPLQTVSPKHNLVYCECVDWTSRAENDQAYCLKTMQERGVTTLVEYPET